MVCLLWQVLRSIRADKSQANDGLSSALLVIYLDTARNLPVRRTQWQNLSRSFLQFCKRITFYAFYALVSTENNVLYVMNFFTQFKGPLCSEMKSENLIDWLIISDSMSVSQWQCQSWQTQAMWQQQELYQHTIKAHMCPVPVFSRASHSTAVTSLTSYCSLFSHYFFWHHTLTWECLFCPLSKNTLNMPTAFFSWPHV